MNVRQVTVDVTGLAATAWGRLAAAVGMVTSYPLMDTCVTVG